MAECMQGLELARRYYEEVGRPAFEAAFPELIGRMAFGLAGEGSECFGFDDAFSRDHDFGPSFCVWLTESDYQAHGAAVQAVYDGLPQEFLGVHPRRTTAQGAGRVGCLSIARWYTRYTGWPDGPQTVQEWRRVPMYCLATATNGAVFDDPLGAFSAVRERLLGCYPEDLRIKKIARCAALMGQAGQYNFPRCLARGEAVAAQLALAEFLRAAMEMVYLLNRAYAPYYKWMHRGLRRCEKLSRVGGLLEQLCTGPDDHTAQELVERICLLTAAELQRQGLSDTTETFLEVQGAEIMAHISDPVLRQTHIMEE